MSPRTIYMNTRGETGSVALSALSPSSYLKEVFTECDALGELRKEKRVFLPINRAGQTFTTVDDLFQHLIQNEEYHEI